MGHMLRLLSLLVAAFVPVVATAGDGWRLARFSADVTVPVGHRCMGVLPVKAREVVDPLRAIGFALVGGGERAVVFVSVDWCEIRNDAYDRWRDALAEAAGTSRERVLVSSVHQHDAPVVDLGAEGLLAGVGLGGELCDVAFHERAVQRVAAALRESLDAVRPVTHVGTGKARVERIASNRRVADASGRVTFARGSASGGDAAMAAAPVGLIDPWLRVVSFWEHDTPLAALSVYATHPMSFYGRGGVSADFPGIARARRQAELPDVLQVYASGCSGDVTAGKHNDGSAENRVRLAGRLHDAMVAAWESTARRPLGRVAFRNATLELPLGDADALSARSLRATLEDPEQPMRERILAAMGLASRLRVEAGRPIDVPCLDLGAAQIVLLPGESFVGYQLMAQRMRPDSFVVAVGYGECWPGYVPTRAAFEDGFGHGWRWVGRGCEPRMCDALRAALTSATPPSAGDCEAASEEITADVWKATEANPRYSEGSIIRRDDGALLHATTEFIGGGSDFASARIVARSSTDGGRTWSEPRVLQENVGGRNVMSVSLVRIRSAPGRGIGMFYLVKNDYDDLRVFMRMLTDDARTFGEPIPVTDAPGYHVMNNDRVVELSDGRLLCPVASTSDVRRFNHFVSVCWISDDGGLSWRRGSGQVDLPRRGAMEPEVIELRDGRLLMIVRTQLGAIWASRSEDRGDTWSEPESWGVESPESPATLRRIPSTGDLLLVWNPDFVEGAGHGGPRTPLAAAVSRDEGRTWSPRRYLETSPNHTYAYTSLTFADDRALLSYYVRDESTGRISSRFRSLPVSWFYTALGGDRGDDETVARGKDDRDGDRPPVRRGPRPGIDWPSFRGPSASGVAEGFATPERWDVEIGTGVRWKTPIPGLGLSSPIVWGDRVWVTTAVRGGDAAELKTGLYGDIESVDDDSPHRFELICLDRKRGGILWRKTAHEGAPKAQRHPKSSHANSTPATDGERVVACFGSEGLYCYSIDGKLLWKTDLGLLDAGFFLVPKAQWGFGSSPVIHGSRVILQCDVVSRCFIAAFDLESGRELWRTPRKDVPTWGTPNVIVEDDRAQVVVNGYHHIGGYDLATGKELWKLRGGGDIPVPTPVVGHGLVFITNAHGFLAPIYAVKTSATGDVSLKLGQTSNEHVAWSRNRDGNYMQTPLVLGDHLYCCRDNGIIACYDARTGERLYRERLWSDGTGWTASLVAADGKIYATGEEGTVVVVRAGSEFERIAVNELGEQAMATPAISEGVLIFRTRGHVIAVSGREE